MRSALGVAGRARIVPFDRNERVVLVGTWEIYDALEKQEGCIEKK